ncbi:hypothetical protein ACF065_12890 [Streptomyces sp. NPDC015232]|uniref:hypothetical protein n=1 Tax=unclassified Streptomyces TaxID=2593676 RepID=UPI0036FBDB1C
MMAGPGAHDPRGGDTARGLPRDLGRPDDALLDLGGLGTARAREHVSPLFVGVAESTGARLFALRVVMPAERPAATPR